MTDDDAFMALAGVRYCLGRHSYAPSLCCGWLRVKWPDLKPGDQAVIIRDIQAHIADQEDRDREPVFSIDVRTWQNFVAWANAPRPVAGNERTEGGQDG